MTWFWFELLGCFSSGVIFSGPLDLILKATISQRLCRHFQDEDEDKPIIGPKLDSRGRMQLGNLDLRAWLQ